MNIAWWRPATERGLARALRFRPVLAIALAAAAVGTLAVVLALRMNTDRGQQALAATVNGLPVTMASYQRQLAYATAGYDGPGVPDSSPTGRTVRQLLVDRALQQAIAEVLIDHAARVHGVQASGPEVSRETARMQAAAGGGAAARAQMQAAHMTPADLAAVARHNVLRDRLSLLLHNRAWLEEAFANASIRYFVSDAPSGPGAGQEVALGRPAPAFVATDLRGRPVSLADLRGRVVVLNFWATWSGYSARELPMLHSFALRHPDIYVVAVNHGGEGKAVRDYVRSHGLRGLTIWLDHPGNAYTVYQMTGVPATFFVDMHGVLRSYNYGALADVAALADQTVHARKELDNTVFSQGQ